jgi:hypothetical protein
MRHVGVRHVSLAWVVGALACTRPSPTGVALDPAVREPSGLTVSNHSADVFWTHGDSGTSNELFAVDRTGKLLAALPLADVDQIDWEDITHDGHGNLWLGDTGNNFSSRRDLVVLRIPEPSSLASVTQLQADVRIGFHYPEQTEFDEPRANFDCEALFWWHEQLWLLTKHRSDTLTWLYRFPALEGDDVALERVVSFDLGPSLQGERAPWSGQVSGAELSPDGKHLALLTYDALFVFATPASGDGRQLFDELVTRINFDMKMLQQVEAVAWDQGAVILVNEDRAVFRIDDPLTRTQYP